MTKPQINVTPLIDVLLVLLIIFMVVSPAKPSRFEARVPRESRDRVNVTPNPESLVVVVGPDSRLTINNQSSAATVGEPATMTDTLVETFRQRQALAAADARDPGQIERAVFIKARSATSYGDVARVVDAVKASGAYPIGLVIDDLD